MCVGDQSRIALPTNKKMNNMEYGGSCRSCISMKTEHVERMALTRDENGVFMYRARRKQELTDTILFDLNMISNLLSHMFQNVFSLKKGCVTGFTARMKLSEN